MIKPDGYLVEETLLSTKGKRKYVYDNLVDDMGVREHHIPIVQVKTMQTVLNELTERNKHEFGQVNYMVVCLQLQDMLAGMLEANEKEWK